MTLPTIRMLALALGALLLAGCRAGAEKPAEASPDSTLHHVGVCHAVDNAPANLVSDASGRHPRQAPIDPHAALLRYFREVLGRDIHRQDRVLGDLDQSVAGIVVEPRRGRLLPVACDPRHQFCEHQTYFYAPEPRQDTPDQAVIEATLNGQRALLYYALQVVRRPGSDPCAAMGAVWSMSDAARAGRATGAAAAAPADRPLLR